MAEIYVILKGHDHFYEIQTTIQIFIQNTKFKSIEMPFVSGYTFESVLENGIVTSSFYEKGKRVYNNNFTVNKDVKYALKISMFMLLFDITKKDIPWGILTGVKPLKIIYNKKRENLSDAEIRDYLSSCYLHDDKINLLFEVYENQKDFINKSDDYISYYAGIPFCPTRCLYCSFVAYPVEKYKHIMDSYVDVLIKELVYTFSLSQKKAESFYIGGGTPTTLSENNLERLLSVIREHMPNDIEFTVEAGRPDTITKEKLLIMYKYGVNRISINPQTMNDDTLRLIGRKHTVFDIVKAFTIARDIGFENINMDTIIGLPNETLAHAENTFNKIGRLMPDGVTVHNLAVKRASKLNESLEDFKNTLSSEVYKMVDFSYRMCKEMGLLPYYLYRQKNANMNQENVGYAKLGCFSKYNIQIMEEKQTILACGAGSTTKVYFKENDRLERLLNVKDVNLYINNIDEIMHKKECIVNELLF